MYHASSTDLPLSGREENFCRFCDSQLPDWRRILGPKLDPKYEIFPTMSVTFNDKVNTHALHSTLQLRGYSTLILSVVGPKLSCRVVLYANEEMWQIFHPNFQCKQEYLVCLSRPIVNVCNKYKGPK